LLPFPPPKQNKPQDWDLREKQTTEITTSSRKRLNCEVANQPENEEANKKFLPRHTNPF